MVLPPPPVLAAEIANKIRFIKLYSSIAAQRLQSLSVTQAAAPDAADFVRSTAPLKNWKAENCRKLSYDSPFEMRLRPVLSVPAHVKNICSRVTLALSTPHWF